MTSQSIENYTLYPEYVAMRVRERKLLHEQEEIREECMDNEDFKEACKIFAAARKKLDDVEKVLREN